MSASATVLEPRVGEVTAEELLVMPDHDAHGDYRLELVNGEVRRMAPAGHVHGRVAVELTWRLGAFVHQHELGAVYAAETGFVLARGPDTVRAPDIGFVARERSLTASDQGFFDGPPDLAVEVVSPRDSWSEVQEKVGDWLRSGTAMVVAIDPRRRRAIVYRSQTDLVEVAEEENLDLSPVVPGFAVRLSLLFA